MVFPSELKLASSGTVVLTVIWAAPLLSEYVASGMALLPKVSVGDAGAVTGSWRNVMRSLPGSAATDGLTGAVKWKTRWEGSSGDTEAVKCVAMFPMKRRPDSWCRVAGP